MTRDRPPSSVITAKQLRWKTIPMGQLVPCKPRQKPQYYELKVGVNCFATQRLTLSSDIPPNVFVCVDTGQGFLIADGPHGFDWK
jgi:hypothetical protein